MISMFNLFFIFYSSIFLVIISIKFAFIDERRSKFIMASPVEDYKTATSVYDFTVKDGQGNDVQLDKYKDNVLVIVNIASKCGLTKSNYKELTDLKQKYEDKRKTW